MSSRPDRLFSPRSALLWLLAGSLALSAGCLGSWHHKDWSPSGDMIPEGMRTAEDCGECHESAVSTWKKTAHADAEEMGEIGLPAPYRECGACHFGIGAEGTAPGESGMHAAELTEDPEAFHDALVSPNSLTKPQVNEMCGRCHFQKEWLGRKSVNPTYKHQLIMDVGFQDAKKILACTDCHDGHGTRRDMMTRSKSMICYDCHLAVEMWPFQLLNWPTNGQTCFFCHPPHGAHRAETATRMVVGLAVVGCLPCHVPGAEVE